MVVVLDFEWLDEVLHLHIVRISIVVSTQKPILLSSKPPLLEGEVIDELPLFVDLQVDVITIEHVLPQHGALFFEDFEDFFF